MLDSSLKLYRYRWLVYELVLRNLRLRYRGSILGLGWTLLNPLIFMVIYTIVFAVYLKTKIPNYPLYILVGIVPFTFFSGALVQGTTSIIDGRYYVGKTLFPTVVLVVVPVLTNAANFILSMPLIIALAIAFKVHLGWGLLMLPIVVLIQTLFTQAVVMLAATVNVFYRDVQELVNYALSALIFMTPIFYLASVVPPKFAAIVAINPLAAIIGSYQQILYFGSWPNPERIVFALLTSIIGLLLANALFERYRESFSEYL